MAAVCGARLGPGKLVGTGEWGRQSLQLRRGPGEGLGWAISMALSPGRPSEEAPARQEWTAPPRAAPPGTGGGLGEAGPQMKATAGPRRPQGEHARSSVPHGRVLSGET